jgi:hypothetical protein
MKLFVPFALLMMVGLILAAGCIATKNKYPVNTNTEVNNSSISSTPNPGLNTTINASANTTSELKGSLRVSISGISYPVNLQVVLDNNPVGTVKPTEPLYLMVSEGNHSVMVCVDSVCEQEKVTTRFGRYVTVDFSERLQRDVKFPNPTARPTVQIIDFYRNGEVVTVDVKFENPESVDHTFSVDLSIGYTYIDSRSHIKLGDSTQARTSQFVKAGQSEIKRVDMYLGSDSIMSFDNPEIQDFKVK